MKLENSINITLSNDSGSIKGRSFNSRFIEPGAVSYGDAGVLKVTKEALDKFVQSFVGCPVIIKHQDLTTDSVDNARVGVVSEVYYNDIDGWYWCKGVIWDKEAIKKIEQDKWTVSCCYNMTESTGEAGEWHNMPYDDELLNGAFEHLAIVPNPRYEDATILLNSKEGRQEMLERLFNSKKIRNSEEEDKEMKKENEESVDKNALKDKIMEHINKAVKGQGDIDGQAEDAWYEALREMLDKLAYSDSESEKSNKKNSDDEEKEEDKKENACKSKNDDSVCEDKKENEDEDEEDKKEENEDDKEDEDEKEEEKDNKKSNSKSDFDKMKRLSNSGGEVMKSGYVSEASRLALGKELF